MARRIEVEIIGDSRQLERAFDRSARSAKKFEAQISGVGGSFKKAFAGAAAAAGVGIGVGVVVDQLKSAVTAASDLSEQMSKTNVVFGKSAAGITEWSKSTATAMGLSQRKSLAAASTFGLLFKNVGQGDAAASDLSTRLVALGADLASLNNTSVQEALDSIRSGLTGEIEPLRKYGVFLSEAATQQQAMADTGKKSAKQLTTGEKVLARYELLMKGTTVAQGDFARTSGGLANQQRILTAQIDDLKTGLGEALLPAITNVVTKMNEWLADPENKKKVIDGFTSSVHALGEAFQFTADTAGFLKSAWDRLPDFGKDKGLIEILDKYIPTLEGPGFKLFAGGGGGGGGGGFSAPGRAGGPGGRGGVAAGVKALQDALGETADTTTAKAPKGISVTQRNAWFDAMISRQISRVQDITSVKGQITRLQQIGTLIQQRIAATKDITRKLNLEDQLLEVQRMISADQAQIAETVAQAQQDAADRRANAQQKLLDRLQLNVDRTGLTDTLQDDLKALRTFQGVLKQIIATQGSTLELQRSLLSVELSIKSVQDSIAANRKAAAAAAKEAAKDARVADRERMFGWLDFAIEKAESTKGTKDDRQAYKKLEQALLARIRAEGRTLELSRELWRIRQKIRDLGKGGGRRKLVGGIWVDKLGNAVGSGLPAEKHVPSIINRFTGAVQDATVALNNFEKLRIFADLKQFGGNLWSRAGAAALGGRMTSPGSMGMPRISRGTGQPGMPGIFGGGGRHLSGGGTVVVNQHFNAPTTDRHREARYAMMATRAVFDS